MPARFSSAIIAAAFCLASSLAGAEETKSNAKLATLLPATVGAKACFTRTYDAKHLAEHPKQRVTAVTLLMRVVGIAPDGDWVLDPAGKYDRVNYQFAMSATRRGDKKPLTVSGYCPDDPAILCIRECDGGGVTLEKTNEALLMRLDENGILMGDCDEKKGVWLKGGTDDKSFRLDKVAADKCTALETSAFTP